MLSILKRENRYSNKLLNANIDFVGINSRFKIFENYD